MQLLTVGIIKWIKNAISEVKCYCRNEIRWKSVIKWNVISDDNEIM